MKKTALLTFLLLLASPSLLLAKYSNLYEQLENINVQWKLQQDIPAYVHQLKPLDNDREAIKTHLCFVENVLRNRDISQLSALQKANRLKNLANLHTYWQKAAFPINTKLSSRNPIFIDDYDNFCAVGYLIKASGNEAISREIQRTQNLAYLKDIHSDALVKWVKDCGLTVGELAWIQPGYMPMNYGMPMQNGLGGTVHDFYMSQTGNLSAVGSFNTNFSTWYPGFAGFDWLPQLNSNTNGTIYAVEFWDNKWYLGGDFTQINGQNFEKVVQIDANGNMSQMGTLNGTVKDLVIFNGEIYAGGSFGIMKWDGTAWQNLGICNGEVRKLYVWKNELIAGGDFSIIGSANANNIAKYNGFYFSNLENGVPNPVNAISDFKGFLFAGTDFADSVTTNYANEKLYYFNDVMWRFADFYTKGKGIYALQEKYGNLYVGGNFDYMPMMGYFGTHLMKVTHYNDTTFALDGYAVLDSPVYCIASHPMTNALFVGGNFFSSFGPLSQPLNSVAYFALTPSAISSPDAQNTFKIFPNPTQNEVNIVHKENAKIAVLEISGKELSLEIEQVSPTESKIKLEGLAKGVYLVRIGTFTQKLTLL